MSFGERERDALVSGGRTTEDHPSRRMADGAAQMSQWFADRVDLVVEPGAHGYMQFGDQGGPVVVETVDPPTCFSFRWNHPRGEEPVAGNSMLVVFTLTPEGDERTRLRVAESGHELRDWPDAEKQRYADEHREGWGEFLDRLAGVLAERRPG